MAEVLGIIGSIGAVVNIIDATSKLIATINDLRARWNDADLTLLSLASQLKAFRAALRRIEEWMETSDPDVHHQLLMDLDDTLSCCATLINRLETISAKWSPSIGQGTNSNTRRDIVFNGKGLDNVLILVERQTNALTLLLTACNW